MDTPKSVSHVSVPREMRLETKRHGSGTGIETRRETPTTKRLIDKVLARSQERQEIRQEVRQDAEAVRQPVKQIRGNLDHPRHCPQWWRGCLTGCEWYHPGGADFCWKVNSAWWETTWPNSPDKESSP